MENYTPLEYLEIDVANQFGYDKKTFPQRLAWVHSVRDLHSRVSTAKKPAQFLAALYAIEDALAGKPSGHLVGLDSCSSGISILGILAGCHTTSANTGVIGGKRMDMYAECTKTLANLLEGQSDIVDNTERDDVKYAQMT